MDKLLLMHELNACEENLSKFQILKGELFEMCEVPLAE
jgi:hypothetical protein